MDAETLARLEQLLTEKHHVIQFGDDGWIIAHPLQERLNGSLFDCHLHWDADDPGVRGRFWLLDDGTLGEPYAEQKPSDG
jgi:uncharacterized protein DUF6085